MQHEIAQSYFNEPVDAEGLGIPEYRGIITVRRCCRASHTPPATQQCSLTRQPPACPPYRVDGSLSGQVQSHNWASSVCCTLPACTRLPAPFCLPFLRHPSGESPRRCAFGGAVLVVRSDTGTHSPLLHHTRQHCPRYMLLLHWQEAPQPSLRPHRPAAPLLNCRFAQPTCTRSITSQATLDVQPPAASESCSNCCCHGFPLLCPAPARGPPAS